MYTILLEIFEFQLYNALTIFFQNHSVLSNFKIVKNCKLLQFDKF